MTTDPSSEDGWVRHGGPDPFLTPEEKKDLSRRLRGRLTSPVSVWTAWARDRRAVGLTVSSLMVGEGDPAFILGLVGPLSDLWEAAEASGRFIVHVLGSNDVRLSDQMAGRYPDDPFRGVSITETEAGPALSGVETRAACTLVDSRTVGWSLLVQGRIDSVEMGPVERPLVHYRSGYVSTGPRRDPDA
ncbi:MAG TPA: flavin reductase family protein [Acidimicrobiales bacterium]|nr:flavin reductase family protein [Acidimicrobiales bacterium]